MIEKGELATSIKGKKSKTKFIDLDHAGNDNQLLLSLGCWLMLARTFFVYNAGLKVDAVQEILTVIMMSNDENVRTHSSSSRVLFLAIAFPFLGLTTVSLDKISWIIISGAVPPWCIASKVLNLRNEGGKVLLL